MSQCSTDISFSVLLLLPGMLSNDPPTNNIPVDIDSEDNSQFSRIELLRHLLVVLSENVEEDGLLSSKSRTQRKKILPGSISIRFLSFIGMMLGKSTSSLLCGFAFAFDLAAKSFTISCDACSSGRSAGLSVL